MPSHFTSTGVPRLPQAIDEMCFMSLAGKRIGKYLLKLWPWRSYIAHENMVFCKFLMEFFQLFFFIRFYKKRIKEKKMAIFNPFILFRYRKIVNVPLDVAACA